MGLVNNIKRNDLTEGSIWKGILFFAVPIMLSNLFQQLYNAIDSAVVGKFAGGDALAAVGSTGPLINLFVGLFLGIATGTGVIYAQYYGARNKRRLNEVINTAMILSVIGGIFLTVVGIALSPMMLRIMHSPENVIGLSVTYLRIYFSGVIVMLIYNVGAGIIRAGGDSRRPLYYLVCSGILNLILDLIFVVCFKMGVSGAAWATVIAQSFSAVLVIVHLMRMSDGYSLKINKIIFSREIAVKIINIGVPCGLQGVMFNISNMIVQTKFNDFGSVAMAGCAAYEKIDGFLYMPMNAIGLAISTFVGQNIGAGKHERIKKGVRVSIILAVLLTVVFSSIVILTGNSLMDIFTNDSEVKRFGVLMMICISPFTFTHCFTEVLGGAIRGAGAALQVLIITAINICVFRIIWLLVLFGDKTNIIYVYLCYPSSWTLCSLCFIIYYLKGNWLNKKVERESIKENIDE